MDNDRTTPYGRPQKLVCLALPDGNLILYLKKTIFPSLAEENIGCRGLNWMEHRKFWCVIKTICFPNGGISPEDTLHVTFKEKERIALLAIAFFAFVNYIFWLLACRNQRILRGTDSQHLRP
jgi:hypothetical protein